MITQNEICSLSDCCEFIKDGTHGSPERTIQGVPVLSASNVISNRLNFITNRFTNEKELLEFRRRLHPKIGDVLLTIVGTIGRTAIVDVDREFIFQRSVCVLRPIASMVIPGYLRYVLRSQAVKTQLEIETKEVAQAGIYLDSINNIWIPVPSLNKQRLIVAQLDKADHLRQSRHYAQTLSDTFLQSVFLEMFGDPVSNPKGWEIGTIGDVCTKLIDYRGRTPEYAPAGIRHITAACIKERSIQWNESKYVTASVFDDYMTRGLPNIGDVIFTTEAPMGETAVVKTNERFSLAQRLILLRPDQSKIDSEYLCSVLALQQFRPELNKYATGSTVKGISSENLKAVKLLIPPIRIQQRFAEIVRHTEKKAYAEREAARQADHLFHSLLNRAFELDN